MISIADKLDIDKSLIVKRTNKKIKCYLFLCHLAEFYYSFASWLAENIRHNTPWKKNPNKPLSSAIIYCLKFISNILKNIWILVHKLLQIDSVLHIHLYQNTLLSRDNNLVSNLDKQISFQLSLKIKNNTLQLIWLLKFTKLFWYLMYTYF